MNKGQSLLEVVLALGVMTLVVIVVVSLATNSMKNVVYAKNKSLATAYTQAAGEWLRGQRDEDMETFKIKASGIYCLSELNWPAPGGCGERVIPGTIFIRSLNLSSALDDGKLVITAIISTAWQDSTGYHEVKTISNFTDRREQ